MENMDITELLTFTVKNNSSDLHISAGLPPMIRVDGDLRKLNVPALDHKEVIRIIYDIMNDKQRKEFEEHLELDFSFEMSNVARFRVNAFHQFRGVAAVFRAIPSKIQSIEDLNLPSIFTDMASYSKGLVLVTGPTGSGKSTTLAAMVDYINSTRYDHILTIEDPIEFIHQHKKSIIDQREVGIDTQSYDNALKNAMREAPDVILIGEIRDRSNMKHAIAYAETGHLCLSTLHANNANQTMDRVINFFPEDARQQLLLDLSLNLKAIISLRLIPSLDNQRIPAVEILLNSPYVADLIEKGKIEEIKDVMERSTEQGMQTFDQALFRLYQTKKISKENAIQYADSKNNVGLKIRLSEEGGLKDRDDLTISSAE